ncbi:hypothetical protein TVAG_276790 [Trichomonas vaginalis G3]|uniref:Uncharacterized protein n=1 Tax=Trichomonas vaginalis (strain ATCC PRA-98 / G3) TaxID=412133 RepID=A2GJM8_TRIV3|nr:hypothetical protein TVAGG3_0108160 [Trichomonas vaginalis G3]EAX82639.1 hypothetical protein TVAG_276790 [Trichomonas vaginalis G3]KAI5544785.1 hypothetical protein TVAGG3_0108160 [Trichomonas vaginalis G3]|eukprot:XP_001295569.1 hypothetical protein [Trichomonas vaginalis G3]
MEIECLKEIVKTDKFQHINAFVSDNDSKAGKVVAKSGAQCVILKDINHTLISTFTNEKFEFLEIRFRGILNSTHLKVDEKIEKWLSLKTEYANHKLKDQIVDLIDSTAVLFNFVRRNCHTNFSEFFNAMKSRYIEKKRLDSRFYSEMFYNSFIV